MTARFFGIWLVAAGLCLAALPGAGASIQIEALLQQAEAVRSSDPQTFQRVLSRLNAAEQRATPQQLEQLRYLNAYSAAIAGRYDEAIREAGKLVDTTPDAEMRLRAGALMVNAYALTRQFTEGLRQLGQTLSLIDKVDEPELRQHGWMVAAQIYNQIGQYKLGLHYADRILAEPAPERTLCFAGQHRQESLQNLRALSADDDPIIRLIEQCVDQKEPIVANLVRMTLARKWASEGQRDEAILLLRQHLAEAEATGYPRLIAEMHSLLAELLLEAGDIDTAERHAQAAIEQNTGNEHSLALALAFKTLHEIADLRDDPKAALVFYRRYAEADKAYLSDVKARELAYEIVRHETLQKNQQIALLNQQNQVLQLQRNLDRQAAQNTRLLIALLVALMATIAYWAYRTKRRHVTLRRLAETDALTGISNRQHFTRLAEQTLAQCAKDGEPAALVMFDLDHFKTINDSYGHVTGDWVLQRVAETCKGFCRRIDHLGRLGGEEFAILLHGCDLDAATRLAEDCRTRIARIETGDSGHAFTVTASFGVTATSVSGYALMPLLSHSDLALYRAKREGRNRVRSYAPELPAQSPLQVVSTIDGKPIHEKRGPLGIVGN